MTAYCFAILSGNDTSLPACTVRRYRSVTCPTYQHALALAARLNAVICGWRVA